MREREKGKLTRVGNSVMVLFLPQALAPKCVFPFRVSRGTRPSRAWGVFMRWAAADWLVRCVQLPEHPHHEVYPRSAPFPPSPGVRAELVATPGVGGSVEGPVVAGIVADLFTKKNRGTAMGTFVVAV